MFNHRLACSYLHNKLTITIKLSIYWLGRNVGRACHGHYTYSYPHPCEDLALDVFPDEPACQGRVPSH